MVLDGEIATVIGVMDADPLEFVPDPDVFEAIELTGESADSRSVRNLAVVGRLKAGVAWRP